MNLTKKGGLKKYIIFSVLILLVFIVIYDHVFTMHLLKKIKMQYKTEESKENENQKDSDLIQLIRAKIIEPSEKPYNLSDPNNRDPSQHGQAIVLNRFFKNKRGGTFIEAGAYDGESLSNTLVLERKFGWTGLLVEPDPVNFWALTFKSRKSKLINCCVSPSASPEVVSFSVLPDGISSHIVNASYKQTMKDVKFTKVTCFPLYSLMQAVNLTTLDLLIIDLEGIEVKVVKSFPWDKVDIKAILVEKTWVPEGQEVLQKYIEGKNYKLEKTMGDDFFFSKIY